MTFYFFFSAKLMNMKKALTVLLALCGLAASAQNQISFKAGINPTFMDRQWGTNVHHGTFKGGWGYKAGFDFSYSLKNNWTLFHGLNIRISKFKSSEAQQTDYFLTQGFTPVSLAIPIGLGYKFNLLTRTAEIRCFLDWNVGIAGRVTTNETTFPGSSSSNKNIVFRNDVESSNESFHLNRFEIGTEFKYEVFKRLSLDIEYSYGVSNRRTLPPVNGRETNGGHSIFAGLSWKLKK
jgi:hypothetical protein